MPYIFMITNCTQNMTLGKCIPKSASGRYTNNMKTVYALFMDNKCTQNMTQGKCIKKSASDRYKNNITIVPRWVRIISEGAFLFIIIYLAYKNHFYKIKS